MGWQFLASLFPCAWLASQSMLLLGAAERGFRTRLVTKLVAKRSENLLPTALFPWETKILYPGHSWRLNLKWLLKKITNGLTTTTQYLVSFGPAGLFGIAFLDSALIPLPGGPDAVMIILSTAHPAWMPLYALAATFGSMFGCLLLYKISKRAGRRALERFSIEKQARVKRLVDQYDVLSVLVSSVLPPPFPFKLFVVTAGVF